MLEYERGRLKSREVPAQSGRLGKHVAQFTPNLIRLRLLFFIIIVIIYCGGYTIKYKNSMFFI